MDDGSRNTMPSPSFPENAEDGSLCVCTWNVNSVKARLPVLTSYLQNKNPDVVMLQEIKTEAVSFPSFEMKTLGYHALIKGQKSYNGVALLSKYEMEPVCDSLPDIPDDKEEQARYIEAYCPALRSLFISVYVPNGEPPANNPDSTERLEYKIAWLDALKKRVLYLKKQDTPFIIGGDFNVIEYDSDVYNPLAFKNSAFTVLSIRQRFRSFYYTGLTNALRREHKSAPFYTYWDYRAGAWEKNNGILLDHLFLSPAWADKLSETTIDSEVRGMQKASDHAPVRCRLFLQ